MRALPGGAPARARHHRTPARRPRSPPTAHVQRCAARENAHGPRRVTRRASAAHAPSASNEGARSVLRLRPLPEERLRVALGAVRLRAGLVAGVLARGDVVFVVVVDVRLLGPPAAGLEGEHAGEGDGADEVRGRELERGLAERRGELGEVRAGRRGREGEGERRKVEGEACCTRRGRDDEERWWLWEG